MSDHEQGSVTRWIGDLKRGGQASAQPLWERYFGLLMRRARKKLGACARHGRIEDEEDAVLSAFASFYEGVAAGRFPKLADRNDFWRLLVVITVRKVYDQIDRANALARGGAMQRGARALDQLVGEEPSPEFASMVVDEYRRLRDSLELDSLRHVLDLRLEGLSREQIAAKIGCAESTVSRKISLIRKACLRRDRP